MSSGSRYREALAWLYSLESRGVKLGLERMQDAARLRNSPHEGTRFVHIAGSNGKGSVAAMLESSLRGAGYRVGQFASPHLQRYAERVRIDGRPIREAEVAKRLEELRDDARLRDLTFFEYTTLLAFEAFRDAKCDIVVLEVGLGGRLDATNIVRPAVSVITTISLEHEHILGGTLAQIAREKAGILKRRVPAVCSARNRNARRAISTQAVKLDVPLQLIGRDFDASWEDKLNVLVGDRRFDGLRLGPRGRYQGDNAACAVAALLELDSQGFSIGEEHIRRGLATTRWPGRLEWHKGEPSFLFDAAHNAEGCERLGEYLDELAYDGRVVLLFGAMQGKNHRAMLKSFDGRVDRRIYAAPEIRRAAPVERFAKIRPGTIRKSVDAGLRAAIRAAGPNGLVVVAGSIFVMSAARALVKGVRTDPPIAM